MSYSDRGSGLIPNRWLQCPRKATRLLVDKFLAFKTPLSEKFDDQVPEHCRFPPKMLFTSMKSYKVRIGLWIDLTNTSRFYDPETVKHAYDDKEVKYVKLSCKGRGETPSEDQTRLFVNMCRQFLSNNPLDAVGVHCTHGFNRTGFLLVSYMIEEMNWGVEAAIQEFAQVRPPGIYKQDYLEELFRRYDEVQYTTPAPPLPSWHTECDDDETEEPPRKRQHNGRHDEEDTGGGSGGGGRGNVGGGGGGKKRHREFSNKNPTFMEGVPGVTPVLDQPRLRQIQTKAQTICKWKKSGFPGCQPVSMDQSNIKLLQKKPYMVSWKADGTRYMMLILKEGQVYCLDRDNSVFQVDGLTFLHRKDPNRPLGDTLLDGEMVIDKHEGRDIPRYLAYDVVQCDGVYVGNMKFPVRLKCIEVDVIGPRHKAMIEGRIRKELEPFSIRLKQFYPVVKAGSLLGEKFSKQLSHEPDGLIFQPTTDPYQTGRCMEVLKWKPSTHNSVDFRLCIAKEEGEGIVPKLVGHLYVGGVDRPFAQMKITKSIKQLDKKIIECKYENNAWVFMRERTDKSFPNSLSTAQSVCNTIQNPITTSWLLEFIERHRYREEEFDMPPPLHIPRR